MRATTGMAPPRAVSQGWLDLLTISPIYYTTQGAVATPHMLRVATTSGSQKLRGFSRCGVSQAQEHYFLDG